MKLLSQAFTMMSRELSVSLTSILLIPLPGQHIGHVGHTEHIRKHPWLAPFRSLGWGMGSHWGCWRGLHARRVRQVFLVGIETLHPWQRVRQPLQDLKGEGFDGSSRLQHIIPLQRSKSDKTNLWTGKSPYKHTTLSENKNNLLNIF